MKKDFFKIISEEVANFEKTNSLKELRYSGIELWPIIRIGYYMARKKQISNYLPPRKLSRFILRFKRLLLDYKYKFKKKSLEGKTTLYFGANTYRVKLNNRRINRYFTHKIEEEAVLIEYDNSLLYLDKKSIDNRELIDFLLLKKDREKISSDKLFINTLNIFKPFLGNLYSEVLSFTLSVLAFEKQYYKLMSVSTLKSIFLLSYYSAPALGATIAANKRNIKTVEVQHGPIGETHLAYSGSSFYNLSKSNVLPKHIHLWHECFIPYVRGTFNSIKVTGNYYLNTYKSNGSNKKKNKILISLQPKDSSGLENNYKDVLRSFKEDTQIIIRLHPRLVKSKILLKDIKYFKNQNIKVSDPYKTPLHEDLNNSFIHLTGYSGTTIEALILGIPTILLDNKSSNFFYNLKNENIIHFCFGIKADNLIQLIKSYKPSNDNLIVNS
jgi:hypothetical protein